MDTTAQNQTNVQQGSDSGQARMTTPQPVPNPQPVVVQGTQQVTQPVQTDQVIQQPVTPVAPAGKEAPPMPSAPQEWVKENPAEMVLPKEAQEVGAEVTPSEVLEVASEVAGQGVTPVGVATPVPTNLTIKFPMTEEKAEGILKMHKKIKDSIYWLAMLIVRQFQILHSRKKPTITGEVVTEKPVVNQDVTSKELEIKEAA